MYTWNDGSTLQHHGILGQKWGKRNGPPYPLDAKRHSASEKKAGWRKSLNKIELTDKQKKAIKIGAIVVGAALITYGAYKVSQTATIHNFIDVGKEYLGAGSSVNLSSNRIGKEFTDINMETVKRMNSGSESGRDINCFNTSLGYILESVFGIKCKAKPFDGIDTKSGMVMPGRPRALYKAIFNGIKETVFDGNTSLDTALKNIPSKSTGILHVIDKRGIAHFLNYEKSKLNFVSLIDCQTGEAAGYRKRIYNSLFSEVIAVLDLSEATLQDDANEIINLMVDNI